MTEEEVIKELKQNIEMPFGSDVSKEASKLAIKVLEEIQKYRSIGTVEECQKVKERQRTKKVISLYLCGRSVSGCPTCGQRIGIQQKYCEECGQRIDWS